MNHTLNVFLQENTIIDSHKASFLLIPLTHLEDAIKNTISSIYRAAIGTIAIRKNGETMAFTIMAETQDKVKRKKLATVLPSRWWKIVKTTRLITKGNRNIASVQ